MDADIVHISRLRSSVLYYLLADVIVIIMNCIVHFLIIINPLMYHELHSSFFYNHQSTDIIVEVGGSCNGENCSRFILIVHLILS